MRPTACTQHLFMTAAASCLARFGWLLLVALLCWLALLPTAGAQTLLTRPADASAVPAAEVFVMNRRIVAFRSDQLGDSAAERAQLAQRAIAEALAAGGPGVVKREDAAGALRFEIDGRPVFFLQPDDVGGTGQAGALAAAAHQVQRRLEQAVGEHRELRDWRQLATSAAYALAATVVAWLALKLLLRGHRWLQAHLLGAVREHQSALAPYLRQARSGLRWFTTALAWVLGLMVAELWITFLLRQFPFTRPWGERSTAWLLEVAGGFVRAIAGAIPGLLVAVLIFLLARVVTRASTLFAQRVSRGETHLSWLDADTAEPTRRLVNVVVWLFALAMAYPYLPGAESDAFKGVSVLAGLMLSLGASGIIGQAMSGFSLMYSRSLRVGEYVKIGDTEGTVTQLGLFATRVHTGMGEEVSMPNTAIFSQPIRNFSRLAREGRFVLHTAVTIGYNTPWRQVHAMLLEAARRTPGVALEPPPYVVQTALSDFYVEYRLCAQCERTAAHNRAAAMSQLHSHVLDVFNENGVQIMSPHYLGDPPEAQVVPPGATWAAPGPQQPLRPET